MKFSEKLQKLRKERGLSQEGMAEMLDVSRQAVSKWESSQTYPETEKLIAISDIFGITLDSLVKDGDLQNDQLNTNAPPFWMTRGRVYEYKSKRTLFGLPLVHVHIGFGAKRAKGIIAIGNIATGLIAVGLIARGFISYGLLSIGVIGLGCLSLGLLLAAGAISIGVFAIGGIALGIFALGGISLGMFTFGGIAAGTHVAIGHHAYGHIAVGKAVAKGVKTFVETSRAGNFPTVPVEEVRQAITSAFPGIWRWIVDFVTGFIR